MVLTLPSTGEGLNEEEVERFFANVQDKDTLSLTTISRDLIGLEISPSETTP